MSEVGNDFGFSCVITWITVMSVMILLSMGMYSDISHTDHKIIEKQNNLIIQMLEKGGAK